MRFFLSSVLHNARKVAMLLMHKCQKLLLMSWWKYYLLVKNRLKMYFLHMHFKYMDPARVMMSIKLVFLSHFKNIFTKSLNLWGSFPQPNNFAGAIIIHQAWKCGTRSSSNVTTEYIYYNYHKRTTTRTKTRPDSKQEMVTWRNEVYHYIYIHTNTSTGFS